MGCGLQSYLAFIPLNRAYRDIRQKSLTTAETRRDGKRIQLSRLAECAKWKVTDAWGSVCFEECVHCGCVCPCTQAFPQGSVLTLVHLRGIDNGLPFASFIWIHGLIMNAINQTMFIEGHSAKLWCCKWRLLWLMWGVGILVFHLNSFACKDTDYRQHFSSQHIG